MSHPVAVNIFVLIFLHCPWPYVRSYPVGHPKHIRPKVQSTPSFSPFFECTEKKKLLISIQINFIFSHKLLAFDFSYFDCMAAWKVRSPLDQTVLSICLFFGVRFNIAHCLPNMLWAVCLISVHSLHHFVRFICISIIFSRGHCSVLSHGHKAWGLNSL